MEALRPLEETDSLKGEVPLILRDEFGQKRASKSSSRKIHDSEGQEGASQRTCTEASLLTAQQGNNRAGQRKNHRRRSFWLLEAEKRLNLKRRHCFFRQPRGKLGTEVHRILIFLSVGRVPWLPTG